MSLKTEPMKVNFSEMKFNSVSVSIRTELRSADAIQHSGRMS